ncbi:MAG TPA: YncE family protein [Pseudolabrys sp.]
MTPDPNNRPGGPHLILTAKSANKLQFFDAATLAKTAEIDMPASTHEMIRSSDGGKIFASVYGGGIFGKNKDPDRRIAVIDLAAKTLERTIDVGDTVAPHSLMMDAAGRLWSTAELGSAVLAIDPDTSKVERIDVGGAPHWIAISHSTGKLFASFKTKGAVAVVDTASRRVTGTIAIPHGAEGIAVTPDGETLLVCAHWKGVVHVIDARSHALRQTMPSPARRVRPTSCAVCGCRRTAVMFAPRRTSTISPPSTRPTRLSRSPASLHRRRRWASTSPPTAATLSSAATTMPWFWSLNWRAAASHAGSRRRPAASSSSLIREHRLP